MHLAYTGMSVSKYIDIFKILKIEIKYFNYK